MKEALSTLNDKYRIILTLFYSEGYHIDEIARILKLPKMYRFRQDFSAEERILPKTIIGRMKGENDMKKNEGNIFLEDIEMPRIVEEKITETLLKIKIGGN